ncbi:S26 family signal peptidase [Streptomyces sp. NPDC091267]|uniref:S26 family signal peptidase n=1 Tax=Streptomyces sp. NPDC091267 TaxID=3155195 RepID=UPI0034207D2A
MCRRVDGTTYRRGGGCVGVERSSGDEVRRDEVRRGDVVLYRVSDRHEGMPVLQRVIGLCGGHIVFADGTLTVKGTEHGPTSPA